MINLPTTALTDEVIGIGNSSGAQIDKFRQFGLTPDTARRVRALLIRECHGGFECRLYDDALVDRLNSPLAHGSLRSTSA